MLDSRRATVRLLSSGTLLLAMTAAGCVSPSPTSAPPSPQLACAQTTLPRALDCREALAVAIAALRQGDNPVRASFEYGTYCGATSGCGTSPQKNRADFGLVTFSYAGNTHSEYVYVVADASGQPRLGSTLTSSPPPIMSVPTPIPSGS
jgi:hypothetical protein